MSQNFRLRFIVQNSDWVNKIYLFDRQMKQMGYISIRWDNKKVIAISSSFVGAKQERYRKILKSNPKITDGNALQNVLLNFDGRRKIVLWLLSGDKLKLYTIPFERDMHGELIKISFGKTLKGHNVRFNRPGKLDLQILKKLFHHLVMRAINDNQL